MRVGRFFFRSVFFGLASAVHEVVSMTMDHVGLGARRRERASCLLLLARRLQLRCGSGAHLLSVAARDLLLGSVPGMELMQVACAQLALVEQARLAGLGLVDHLRMLVSRALCPQPACVCCLGLARPITKLACPAVDAFIAMAHEGFQGVFPALRHGGVRYRIDHDHVHDHVHVRKAQARIGDGDGNGDGDGV